MPNRPAKRRAFKWTLIGLCLLIVVLWSSFSFTSVCPTCATERHTTQLQIPLTSATYFSWSSESATPVSVALASIRPAPPHSHQWVFAVGGGNGVMCAIGEGRHLLGPYRSPETAAFVKNVAAFDPPQLPQVLKLIADSNGVRRLDMVVRGNGFPPAGFTSRATYENWKAKDPLLWDDYINQPISTN